MGFNEISANEKLYFRKFSPFGFLSQADKDGKVGLKVLLIMPRLG